MEIGPGVGSDVGASSSDPLSAPEGMRAELFNWANALGAYQEESIGLEAGSGPLADAARDGRTVLAWRPGPEMPLALRRLNK